MTRRFTLAPLAGLGLVAIVTLVGACRDREPTSSASSHARHSAPTAMRVSAADITIPTTPGGFASQVLGRGYFPDAIDASFRVKLDHETMVSNVKDPSDVVFAKVTFQPGGSLPWHTHPGPAVVSVVQGELVLVRKEGCEAFRYPPGTALVDPGMGMVHIGFNGSEGETILYVTYLGVPKGTSPLIPVPNPGC